MIGAGLSKTSGERILFICINANKVGVDHKLELLTNIIEAHQLRIFKRLRSRHGSEPKNRPSMDEIVLSGKATSQMNEVIRQFNIAIEQRLERFIQGPRIINPKPSQSTIFSMGSFVPVPAMRSSGPVAARPSPAENIYVSVSISQFGGNDTVTFNMPAVTTCSNIEVDVPTACSGLQVKPGLHWRNVAAAQYTNPGKITCDTLCQLDWTARF